MALEWLWVGWRSGVSSTEQALKEEAPLGTGWGGESLVETAEFTFLIKTGLQESGEVTIKHAAFFFPPPKINVPAFLQVVAGCPFVSFRATQANRDSCFLRGLVK